MQILLMEGLTLRLDENTTTPTEGGRGGEGDIIIVYIIYRCIAITDLCNLMVGPNWPYQMY